MNDHITHDHDTDDAEPYHPGSRDYSHLEWIQFPDPADPDERIIRANVTFLLSNYECFFGRGCPGLMEATETTYGPDSTCCRIGVTIEDDEHRRMQDSIAQLTDEDWDPRAREWSDRNGGPLKVQGTGKPVTKTRVHRGRCVFSNPADTGKPGCAFYHLAERTGQDRFDLMPDICSTVPVRFEERYDQGVQYVDVTVTDRDGWYDDPSVREAKKYVWWCTNAPEGYEGADPVYKSYEIPLRRGIGDAAYEVLADKLARIEKEGGRREKMAGETVHGGRPLLPLHVLPRQSTAPDMPEHWSVTEARENSSESHADGREDHDGSTTPKPAFQDGTGKLSGHGTDS